MIRKYQDGGQQLTETQQQGLQYLAQMYTQQTGKDPQQDQQGFMQFLQQLAQQAGVESIGQLLDMVYQQAQGQAQAARRGAKLNYLKKLAGKCPEGTELMYFKAGGRVCSKCVNKKKIQKEACGKKMKKGCVGVKMKLQSGNKIDKDYRNKADYSKPNKRINTILDGERISLDVNNGQLYGEDPIIIKGKDYYLTGNSKLVNSNQIKRNKRMVNGKVVKDQNPAGPMQLINLEDPRYGGVTNRLGLRPPENLRGYWLEPGVTVTSKNGKPYIFDRRVADIGAGRGIISDAIFNYTDPANQFLGDIAGIAGQRTIYVTPNGNDTIFGRRSMGTLGEENGGYKWMGYNHGFMPVTIDSNDQESRKRNFYEALKKTRRPSVSEDSKYYNEYKEQQKAYDRAKRGN